MSDEPFESAEFEAAWGAKKAEELKALRERFFVQGKNCFKVTELNPLTGQYEVKIRVTEPLPIEARGIVSDAIKSFRSALDQAVFAATLVFTGKANRKCHFPFGENPDDLEDSLSRRKAPHCKGIPEELFPVLRSCEPYPRGDGYPGGNDALKALGRVSGRPKHEVTLRVSGSAARTSILPGVLRVGPGGGFLHAGGWNYAKSEMVLFSFPPGGFFEADVEVTLSITFGPGPLENVLAEDLLITWAHDVPARVQRIKAAALALASS